MCKCIYCNSTDLTISDIISCALTGKKLTRRFVCREHNAFTNNNFEKKAIKNLAFFRNALGLTDRSGNIVKYEADIIIDGIVLPNVKITDRSAFYENRKILYHSEIDGKEFLVGSLDQLRKKRDIEEDRIKILDTSDASLNVTFSLEKLFASNEMLCTIAKIAYEWYCYINGIDFYNSERFKDIVDAILLKKPIEDFVFIVTDEILVDILNRKCRSGWHALHYYADDDGNDYVVYDFWGVVVYKIKIGKSVNPNISDIHKYKVYLYGVDGEYDTDAFGAYGARRVLCLPAKQAINTFFGYFQERMKEFIFTKDVTLIKTKAMADELELALNLYKTPPHDFLRVIAYGDSDRIFILRFLNELKNDIANYNLSKSFVENIEVIFGQENPIFYESSVENTKYIRSLESLHEQGTLTKYIENELLVFNQIQQ